MAPKVVKTVPKREMVKPIEKVISKSKKPKKKNYTSFSAYLFKLLKSVNSGKESQGLAISRHSMLIMNNFVNDMLEKVAVEAGRLACYSKKNTITSQEILGATKLLLPKELADHATAAGINAITKYNRSRQYILSQKQARH